MLYVGIDLGTSSTKLLLMNEKGSIVATASRDYPLSCPHPGWSEQNPREWWDAVCSAMPELLEGVDPNEVKGIGCGGQMHGLVVLDEQGDVIRPAILWNDGRTEKQVEYLNETIGKEKLSAWTANIAFAGFTAPKILWMQENEPELFSKVAKIMLPKDYLTYRLTGVHATDFSDASGMLLLDVEHHRWSKPMLDVCGISESMLPMLHESYEAVGTLLPGVARELGLPASVVVCAGAGDNAAAAVGCGAVGEGRCNISLGTSGTVFISSERFGVDSENALHSFDHADGGYHLMGCILSAASCNKWWLEDVLGTTDYAGEQMGISVVPPTTDAPYFLPYLMGERSPHNDPSAGGAFVGMRIDTTREEMTRAVLEGVSFALRDCIEVARRQGIAIDRGTLCGGGSRSALWQTMLADICDMTLELPQTEQGPGYGGAILAAVACGDFPSVEVGSRKLVRIRGEVGPDPRRVAGYERRYHVWRSLYPALRPAFHEMTGQPLLNS